MGRTPVQTQVEEALKSVQADTARQIAAGDWAGEPVYIESMLEGQSNFTPTNKTLGPVKWEPHGFEGSIQQVSPSLLRDSAFRRRLQRGILRQLTAEDVEKRLSELKPIPGMGFNTRDGQAESVIPPAIEKALAEGASEQNHRFARDDLQDQAFEKGQLTPEQIYGAQPRSAQPQTVRRSEVTMPNTNVKVEMTELDGPLAPDAVLTDTVHEGELQTEIQGG